MRTYCHLAYEKPTLPDRFDGDPRTPPVYVETFLREFTAPGETVLDPFAGFGTTLPVATDLDRPAVGIEYDTDRATHAREQAPGATVHDGDALTFPVGRLPAADRVFTSPPYMVEQDERNPFENYDGESDYDSYLADLRAAFARLRPTLEPAAPVLVDVSNMKYKGRVTTLAWDVSRELSEPFAFEVEIVVTWEGDSEEQSSSSSRTQSGDGEDAYGYGYDHSYLLVFEHRG